MTDDLLIMNPHVDIHLDPQPASYPIDVSQIATITVRCPLRGRGLVSHELVPGAPLFAFFIDLVRADGELALDSDAPLIDDLVALGFLVPASEVVAWPALAIALPDPIAVPADPVVAPTLRYQPAFALHPGVRWPADYSEQDGRLRCFAPGPACWVGAAPDVVTPFWLTDEDAHHVAALRPGESPPALPPALAGALAAAGALVPRGARSEASERLARYRAGYQRDGYVVARDFVPRHELAALRRYYAALLAADLLPLGDRQMRERYSAYNDPVGRFVHARLTATMSAVAGVALEPSFSYFFSYLGGAVLEPHKDRPQAEYSISIQLDHTPTPDGPTGWPLCFEDAGRTTAADLALGDAVLYHGRAVTHFRAALPAAQRSSVLVLEYVPADFAGLRV